MTALLAPTRAYTPLIADAVRAPSSHNTQPWLFRAVPGQVDLYADRTRALPVNDPYDRELVMSCGAALANLCAAAVHHHFTPTVTPFPSDDDPDLLASVQLAPAPAYSDSRTAYGIRLRGTWRADFTSRPVAQPLVDDLVRAAKAEGAWLTVVTPEQRPELVELVATGDRLQFESPGWRRELAAWMHPRRSGDGLRVPPVAGAVSRFVVSHVDVGDRTARQDAELTSRAPLLAVLGTPGDDEPAWLAAGRALGTVLLTAAVVGVQAGYSNQPCQAPQLRPRLARLVGRAHPQVVLRLGYPPEQPEPTPRRPVEDVLLA